MIKTPSKVDIEGRYFNIKKPYIITSQLTSYSLLKI